MKEVLYGELGKYENSVIKVTDLNSDNQFMMIIIGQPNIQLTIKKGDFPIAENLPPNKFSGLLFRKGKRIDWFFEEQECPKNISFTLTNFRVNHLK